MKITLISTVALCAYLMGSIAMRAVVWMPLIETERKIEATGHVEKDEKGYVFKTWTGDKVYFKSGDEDLERYRANKAIFRLTAFLFENKDGDEVTDSYCMMRLK